MECLFFINILFFIYKLDTILKIILFQIKLGMKFVRNRICKKKKIPLVYVHNIMWVRHKIPQPLLFLLHAGSCGQMSNYAGLTQKYSLTSINETLQHLSQSCLYVREYFPHQNLVATYNRNFQVENFMS